MILPEQYKDSNMKEIRCFIENASLATPNTRHTSPIYELSEEGKTFAKRKERRTLRGDDKNLLHSFHVTDENELNPEETRLIIQVVETFNTYLETISLENKPVIVTKFAAFYNNSFENHISNFNYNQLINVNKKLYPDFLTFKVEDLNCSVWLSDKSFKLFYPLYDIDVVTPFEEFDRIVRNAPEMIEALNKFDLNLFGMRIDEIKGGFPSTYTQMLNVPYRPRKGAQEMDCWFGFNIYGEAGNYEYLMRDELYKHLKGLGLDDDFIEEHFPSIFKVNEFFMVPEWNDYALPFRVGQGSINSQVNKAFDSPFRMNWYVKAYEDSNEYMLRNTYNVPLPYNNILCRVLNGKYSLNEIKDFKEFHKDLITVNSTNPDFARMSERTQRFVVMTSFMIACADAHNETELFNNLMTNNAANRDHRFTMNRRMEITYISIQFDKHRYYMIPRYEFDRLTELNLNDE